MNDSSNIKNLADLFNKSSFKDYFFGSFEQFENELKKHEEIFRVALQKSINLVPFKQGANTHMLKVCIKKENDSIEILEISQYKPNTSTTEKSILMDPIRELILDKDFLAFFKVVHEIITIFEQSIVCNS